MLAVLPFRFCWMSQVAAFDRAGGGGGGDPVPSDNTNLSVFMVDGSDVTDGQTVNLTNGTTSVTVVATPEDASATVGSITGDIGLVTGDNPLSFTVTAEDGVTTREYTLTLHVLAPPVNSVAPAIQGSAGQFDSISTGPGSWTNSPTSYAYSWQYSDDGGTSWSDTAFTGAGVNGSQFTPGQLIRSGVIASNADGSSEIAYSNSCFIIAPE